MSPAKLGPRAGRGACPASRGAHRVTDVGQPAVDTPPARGRAAPGCRHRCGPPRGSAGHRSGGASDGWPARSAPAADPARRSPAAAQSTRWIGAIATDAAPRSSRRSRSGAVHDGLGQEAAHDEDVGSGVTLHPVTVAQDGSAAGASATVPRRPWSISPGRAVAPADPPSPSTPRAGRARWPPRCAAVRAAPCADERTSGCRGSAPTSAGPRTPG